MKNKIIAAALVLGTIAVGASSCTEPEAEGTSCSDGKGHWIEDESGTISTRDMTTVIVRICVDDGGNVIDMEVD